MTKSSSGVLPDHSPIGGDFWSDADTEGRSGEFDCNSRIKDWQQTGNAIQMKPS